MNSCYNKGDVSVCRMGGRTFMLRGGEVYVDGIHYVPEQTQATKKARPEGMVTAVGKMTVKDVQPEAFNTVENCGPLDVIVEVNPDCEEPFIQINAPEDVIEYAHAETEFSTLKVYMDPGEYVWKTGQPYVKIVIPTLMGYINSGDATLRVSGVEEGTPFLSIKNKGAGTLDASALTIYVMDMIIENTGSGPLLPPKEEE